MGYAGATYLVQEVCNALFDALFHILPLGSEMDAAQATPDQPAPRPALGRSTPRRCSTRSSRRHPVLTRISAAKSLRDEAERRALDGGHARVERPTVASLQTRPERRP